MFNIELEVLYSLKKNRVFSTFLVHLKNHETFKTGF